MPDGIHRRHDLLCLGPEAWTRILIQEEPLARLSDEQRRFVEQWAEASWPVIVRRPTPRDDPRDIAIGMPLPPALGKLRLGLSISPDMIAETVDPLTPGAGLASAPTSWHGQLRRLEELGRRFGIRPALFGALLWQHLTGATYLHDRSDLDCILPMPARDRLPLLLEALAQIDTTGPCRLDGEIVLANGDGISWRELHDAVGQPDSQVLAKSMSGARLTCTSALLV